MKLQKVVDETLNLENWDFFDGVNIVLGKISSKEKIEVFNANDRFLNFYVSLSMESRKFLKIKTVSILIYGSSGLREQKMDYNDFIQSVRMNTLVESDEKSLIGNLDFKSLTTMDYGEAGFFSMLEKLYQPVILIDTNGRIWNCNSTAEQFFSFNRRRCRRKVILLSTLVKIKGMNYLDLIANENLQNIYHEVTYTDSLGETGSLQICCVPCPILEGGVQKYIVYLNPVSIEIQLQNKVKLEKGQKEEIESKLTKTETELENVAELAYHDHLTGLSNKRYFEENFSKVISSAKVQGVSLGVALFDVDFFKKVNDTYGHHQGDLVLQEVGRILKETLRQSDIVCRYGGEEFIALIPDVDDEKGLFSALERVRKNMESLEIYCENISDNIKITISIGGSYCQNQLLPDQDFDSFYRKISEQADQNLYKCKANGRNQIQVSVFNNLKEVNNGPDNGTKTHKVKEEAELDIIPFSSISTSDFDESSVLWIPEGLDWVDALAQVNPKIAIQGRIEEVHKKYAWLKEQSLSSYCDMCAVDFSKNRKMWNLYMSEEIREGILAMTNFLKGIGVSAQIQKNFEIVSDEILSNSFYHAQVPDGIDRKAEVSNDENSGVAIVISDLGDEFSFQVIDRKGSLNFEHVKKFMFRNKTDRNYIEKPGGAGLGLYLVLSYSKDLTIKVSEGTKTEVMLTMPKKPFRIDRKNTCRTFIFCSRCK